jgi:putative toxin-antitoxin system antitoxin component (TIGR02293 family)
MWEIAMAERQHRAGSASERPKGAERDALAKGAKTSVDPKMAEKIIRPRIETAGSERVRAGPSIVDPRPEKRDLAEHTDDDFETIVDLLGGSQTLGSAIKSELDAHELLNQGLPRAALGNLLGKLDVIEIGEASAALGMSLRTLQRHKNTPVAPLDVQQSGRAWKFAEILAKATRVLGSQDEAEQWLKRPAIGLDQQRPIDLLTTPAGVKLVEDYLGRLEYDGYT